MTGKADLAASIAAHDGNRNSSEEEIEAIVALVSRLTKGTCRWVNEKGNAQGVTGKDDILVVAPYNAQVSRLTERLAPTRAKVGTVGTVDKFQGQEARCGAILVASPRLFEPERKTPRQMRLANALCRFWEVGPAAERSVIRDVLVPGRRGAQPPRMGGSFRTGARYAYLRIALARLGGR